MSDSKMTFGANPLVLRQTAESEFTHFDDGGPLGGMWDRLLELVRENYHRAKPGYREGVCLVPVPGEHFYTGVVALRPGDRLVGEYKPRRPGEEPRKTLRVLRESPDNMKSRCVAVDVVLYRQDVLEEDGDDNTGSTWDVVAINGRITEEEQPMHPDTMIANHFKLDGGTDTGWSSDQFERELRKAVLYWKDKAILAP